MTVTNVAPRVAVDVVLALGKTSGNEGGSAGDTQESADVPRCGRLEEASHSEPDNGDDILEDGEGTAHARLVGNLGDGEHDDDGEGGRRRGQAERGYLRIAEAVLEDDGEEEKEAIQATGSAHIDQAAVGTQGVSSLYPTEPYPSHCSV